MIIGHGDIATALKNHDREGFIFFASGVSNSSETREGEYKRELDLLLSQNKKNHLVYFGSLCIYYSANRYAAHKMHMESLVKKNFKHYTIIRIGNITWGKNPHTLINFFKNAKKNGQQIQVLDTYRYIVNKKEFLHWIDLIPQWNTEMNITGNRMKVEKIIKRYVK